MRRVAMQDVVRTTDGEYLQKRLFSRVSKQIKLIENEHDALRRLTASLSQGGCQRVHCLRNGAELIHVDLLLQTQLPGNFSQRHVVASVQQAVEPYNHVSALGGGFAVARGVAGRSAGGDTARLHDAGMNVHGVCRGVRYRPGQNRFTGWQLLG